MNQLSNKEISSLFELMADLLELAGENPFKIKSYSIAGFRIGKLPEPLLEMSDADVKKIENLGPSMLMKIAEIKETGTMQDLEDLLKETPVGVLEILQIKGLGAKKVRQLWLELEVETIGELAYACQENRLTALKGFGKKTQDNILANIHYMMANKGKHLLGSVRDFAIELLEALINTFPDHTILMMGDIIRQNNIVSSIDFISDLPIVDWNKFFQKNFNIALQHTPTHSFLQLERLPLVKVRSEPKEELGKIQFQNNASEAFLSAFLKDYKLPITAYDEAAIFEMNGLPFIPASLREIQNYDAVVKDKKVIRPVQESDIKGLIHCHSKWSDGLATIKDMAKACIKKGWEYMVITDHSVAAFYANGLTADRVLEQHKEIDKLNLELAPFRIYKGIEADILYSGDLDYNEQLWPHFEVIIASVHSNLRMPAEKANERILKALDNPHVKILGHATGRLLLSRDGYPIDHKLIIDKCAAKNVVIEINAHPRRLDLDWEWINYALEKGVTLSINPDAHSILGIDLISNGILATHKSLLQKEQNLSSFSKEEFEKRMGL